MVSTEININSNLDTVWTKIEEEFAKTFKCDISKIKDREIKFKAKNYLGKPVEVTQKIVEYIPNQEIAIRSKNNYDLVTTKYQVTEIDGTTTKVQLSVKGTNEISVLKSWNYFLMSLPILRSGTKRRLRLQLHQLKNIIESQGAGK